MSALEVIWGQAFEVPSPRAHALQIVQTSRALAAAGHRAEIFVWSRQRDGVARFRSDQGAESAPGWRVTDLRPWHRGLAGFALRRASLARLRSAGPRTVFYARHLRHAAWLLRRRADRSVPIVYELHNLEHRILSPDDPRATVLARTERRVLEGCDHVVAISAPLAADAADFARLRGISVLEDGVDLAAFPPAPWPRLDVPVRLVHAGSLYRHKGVDTLVAMMALLPDRFHLSIHGGNDPSDLERLQRAARDAGVADRITFTGQQDPRAIPGLLQDGHMIVLPSSDAVQAQRYTSPLKLFEALAAGRPIVAAPSPTHVSVLAPDLAYLATDGTGAALAQAVGEALSRRDAWPDDVQRTRRAAGRYSWSRRAERLVEILDSVLARRDVPDSVRFQPIDPSPLPDPTSPNRLRNSQ